MRRLRAILATGLALAVVHACTHDFGEFRNDGTSTGGSSAGGMGTGASTGGTSAGGSSQGGSAQGGSAQGGSAQGGNAQGGNAQGGNAQGGTGGIAQGGGGGGAVCPDDGIPPTPGNPPGWSCNGGTNLCTLDCNSTDECKDDNNIACPTGWECRVRCRGGSSCQASTINCGDYPCTIECEGNDACQDATINCGTATCNVECSNNATACSGNMAVNCATGYRCSMDCQAPATAPPNVNNCPGACECIEC